VLFAPGAFWTYRWQCGSYRLEHPEAAPPPSVLQIHRSSVSTP